ncbi:MAG: error-prone DNA polymerase [Polyangiaceae bacterium]|nr:error-prone DNA polymerase [Polyangiaceae bacterium]
MSVFAELLARSCFSLLRGASQPEELVERAGELGLAALAVADRDGLYGAVRAWVAARERGLPFVVAAELSLVPPGVSRDRLARDAARGAGRRAGGGVEPPVVVLACAAHAGYTNLCHLLTRAHAGLPKGTSALEPAWLAERAEGLVALVPAPDVPGGPAEPPEELLAVLAESFGAERAFVAVHRHLTEHDARRVADAEARARRHGLELVASARPLLHVRARKPLADVLTCLREGITLDEAGTRLAANAEACLRGERELRRLFPGRSAWIERTAEVASGLRFHLGELRYHFPCSLAEGETADAKLARLVAEGGLRRYPGGVPAAVGAQLERELALIATLGVAPYFVSTWEIVEIARAKQILCQGRGSAANSAVCFVLGITAVDPARSSLLFERFMSAERHEPPDIDVDFEHERREEVIQAIYERWGRDRAAMVCEVIRWRARSALREVGKALGLSLEQGERLSHAVVGWEHVEACEPRLAEHGFDVTDTRVREVVALARELEGMPRHLSIHVGGFVLSASPLAEVAPVEPARMPGRTVMPWDKDDIDALGFFKVDVLGLGMLTAIRKALALRHAELTPEEPFDPLEALASLPAEDPRVYALCSRADTVGIFQIESRAQQAMLPRLRPACFYDLVVEVALVRPGPIQGGMVHPYLRRRNGEEPAVAPHPCLEPILARTLGVPLFQEQVMQIAIVGAGYTGGEADRLRRDMAAWRRTGRLLQHRQRLLDGFAVRGIRPEFGEALFEQIKGFGEYGFPESHAASFALLVYASAWLKAWYPAEFVCALLASQPMGFYSPSSLVRDAREHGVVVREPCVLRSEWDARLERDPAPAGEGRAARAPALRLGLRLVRGIGEATALRVVAAREPRPPATIGELERRAALRRDELEALAEAGALAALEPDRRQALWQARAPRAPGLFAEHEPAEPRPALPALRAAERLALDYERKGLCLDDHPLRLLRAGLGARRDVAPVATCARFATLPRGAAASVAGLVLGRQRPATASGVVFVTLEDETGVVNVIVRPAVWERDRLAGRFATVLLVEGTVERQAIAPRRDESAIARANGPTPVVHLLASRLVRLDVPGQAVAARSRDFR